MITRACEQCGASFQTHLCYLKRGGGRFCSPGCSDKAHVRPLADRFWANVEKSDGCWLWAGRLHTYGYGQIAAPGHGGGDLYAHRVSWELHFGPIEDTVHVLHKCDNPPCVNPRHLFLGDAAANMADMAQKLRSGRAKLNPEKILEARRLREQGWTYKALGEQFGVAADTVSRALRGKFWRHLRSDSPSPRTPHGL